MKTKDKKRLELLESYNASAMSIKEIAQVWGASLEAARTTANLIEERIGLKRLGGLGNRKFSNTVYNRIEFIEAFKKFALSKNNNIRGSSGSGLMLQREMITLAREYYRWTTQPETNSFAQSRIKAIEEEVLRQFRELSKAQLEYRIKSECLRADGSRRR